jgi:indolepyruvate ferredoxin oxidoreductase
MPANLLLLGAAYQAGAVPISGEAIEEAIRLNGVAVDTNIQAFRWGRLAVIDPEGVERINHAHETAAAEPPVLDAAARQLVESVGASGELERLLIIRVPELIAYQNEAYARRYVEFVGTVRQAEEQATPGESAISEAVARNLFKLMAYKDEYEVARLHLETAAQARLAESFGEKAKVYWRLHPPFLRALGMESKLRLGSWFTPAMKTLRGMRRVRGTALDLFGHTDVRRTERALIDEYQGWLRDACGVLTPENAGTVRDLAGLPDMVRGYEQIKLDNVRLYHEEATKLLAGLGIEWDRKT